MMFKHILGIPMFILKVAFWAGICIGICVGAVVAALVLTFLV